MTVLPIRRGADFRATMRFKNADGSAINLTGFTVTADFIGPAGSVVAATVATINLVQGELSLALEDAVTATMAPGRVWVLRITLLSAGGIKTVEEAQAELF